MTADAQARHHASPRMERPDASGRSARAGFAWNGKIYPSLSKSPSLSPAPAGTAPGSSALRDVTAHSTRNNNKKSVCPTDQ